MSGKSKNERKIKIINNQRFFLMKKIDKFDNLLVPFRSFFDFPLIFYIDGYPIKTEPVDYQNYQIFSIGKTSDYY
jgi:hypothetical protein